MLPKQLLKAASAEDLEELQAFENIEPWGYLTEEYRAANLIATIRNMMLGKDGTPVAPVDFMPNHPSMAKAKAARVKKLTTPTQSVDDMKQMLKSLAGGKRQK